jgi:hypothetical protein
MRSSRASAFPPRGRMNCKMPLALAIFWTLAPVLRLHWATAAWEKGGIDIDTLPSEWVMDTGDMVDAALAGLDRWERVTIPALPDIADWTAFKTARTALLPNLSIACRRSATRWAPT